MLWIIMLIVGVLFSIVAIQLFLKGDDYSVTLILIGSIGLCAIMLSAIGIPTELAEEKNLFTQYEMLSQYASGYEYANEVESATIAAQKFEYNKELIKEKANAKNYPWLYFYPEKIQELELLK